MTLANYTARPVVRLLLFQSQRLLGGTRPRFWLTESGRLTWHGAAPPPAFANMLRRRH